MRRKVISVRPDPENRYRKRYGLECGHSVSRNNHGTEKKWAICGYCDAEATEAPVLEAA